ncbi:hypothetical protein U0070_022345, partial [Myodes glareolus]
RLTISLQRSEKQHWKLIMKPPGLLDVLIKKKKVLGEEWRKCRWQRQSWSTARNPRSARLALETKGLRISPRHNGFPTGQLRLLPPLQLHPSLHCDPETRTEADLEPDVVKQQEALAAAHLRMQEGLNGQGENPEEKPRQLEEGKGGRRLKCGTACKKAEVTEEIQEGLRKKMMLGFLLHLSPPTENLTKSLCGEVPSIIFWSYGRRAKDVSI